LDETQALGPSSLRDGKKNHGVVILQPLFDIPARGSQVGGLTIKLAVRIKQRRY
jgi:hypothetical protein